MIHDFRPMPLLRALDIIVPAIVFLAVVVLVGRALL